jgi:hypothetical protein
MKLVWTLLILAGTVLAPVQQQQQTIEQQRQEAERRAAEQRRQQEEENRRKRMEEILGPSTIGVPKNIPFVLEPGVCAVMPEDTGFDLQSIPLKEWLAEKDVTEIPWKVQVDKPQLRMDQRHSVAYSVRIRLNNVNEAAAGRDFVFVSIVSSIDGRWLIPPKAGKQPVKAMPAPKIQVQFNECVFARPGEYVLWLVLYDIKTGMHNVAKRRIQVLQLKDDPLPQMNSRLPLVEFPQLDGRDPQLMSTIPGRLFLPVDNKRPIGLELVAIVSPSEQWPGRLDILNSQRRRVLAAVTTLAQMQLSNSSISVTGIDLVNRQIPFEQRDLRDLNWSALAAAFARPSDAKKVTVGALENSKIRGAFFRDMLAQRLRNPAELLRVIVVVSNNVLLEAGSDLEPLRLEGDCHCRFYHIRFPLNKDDVFDDIRQLIKRFQPKTFNVASARDLREAVAAIASDIATF